MKKIILSLALSTFALAVYAQSPARIKYQAIVRDGDGDIVANQMVGQQISILQGGMDGTVVYVETHTPTSNAFGLVNLEIGGGITNDDFSAIDWNKPSYFVKVELDLAGGTNYTIESSNQLLSIPYALFANTAGTAVDDEDKDPMNEIELPTGGDNEQVLSTDGNGNYSWVDNGGGSAATYVVGQKVLGGTVFYVNADGTHGLVAANQDQYSEDVNWFNAHNELNDPNNHDSEGAKYLDWRLPTKWELNVMYFQRSQIGGFEEAFYWSSTEISNEGAWGHIMDDGNVQATGNKSNFEDIRVRAIRAF